MRNHLIALLAERAAANPSVVFLTGDLGFNVVEPLEGVLGERFINAGIAEANMVSMAGSLAASGLEPWLYSIAPFMTVRCLEQIRNDVCYERRTVHLIGVGAGYSYGTLGPTHHALEDASLLATLPHMRIACPSTRAELTVLFGHLQDASTDPIYWRIDREPGPDLDAGSFELDEVVTYREGSDALIVASGSILAEALKAAGALAEGGTEVGVVSVPCPAPFPTDALAAAIGSKPVVSVFEGFADNPLDIGVMRAALKQGVSKVTTLNAGRAFARSVGNTGHLRERAGVDAPAIGAAVKALLA